MEILIRILYFICKDMLCSVFPKPSALMNFVRQVCIENRIFYSLCKYVMRIKICIGAAVHLIVSPIMNCFPLFGFIWVTSLKQTMRGLHHNYIFIDETVTLQNLPPPHTPFQTWVTIGHTVITRRLWIESRLLNSSNDFK